MIIVKLIGALGNQLFQYALGRYMAIKYNTELKLDIAWNVEHKDAYIGSYQLGNFNVIENFATPDDIKNCAVVREPVSWFMPEILNCPDNIFLDGYWQSEKYFSDIADIIRSEFTLKNPLGKVSNSWREKILAADCAVSLHIRRGDYVRPMFRSHSGIIPVEYYGECVNQLKKSIQNFTLFVFSDDLSWAKENLNFGVPIEFVEGCEKDCEDMYLMSLCQHNIIANSTFSFWGAWLNKNPDKKVFAPYPWHRDGWGGDTVVPEEWIKIPVNYDKARPFSPTLSVIVYIENSIPANLNVAIQSIFYNTFDDYEVIFVDASTDNSGKICRNFANRNNVTFLKTSPSTDKYTAWNRGLSCANGDYVLFLTGRDFVLSHTVMMICQILENDWNQKHYAVDKYMSYHAYIKTDAPNIIVTAQRIEENTAGSINISDLPDKKFTVTIDTPFQNLNTTAEIQIDSAQKLIMLATNQLNNLLGTKFFRRAFLVENKIRFDEKLKGGGAGFMFLIDVFMRTEKVFFVPQIFYGRLS